jgi:hypothetical protein
MNMDDTTLDFSGSEVLALVREGDALVLHFAVACVRRSQATGERHLEGFLKPLSMRLEGGTLLGEPGVGMGALSEGSVSAASSGLAQASVVLPWRVTGPVELELVFRQGAVWRISAVAAQCVPGPDARFTESYAC